MVQTALFDPIIVEPVLTPLKITELLSARRESAKLDYKLTLDLSETGSKVELVKDLMAMANTAGGYIVVGVDDAGTVRGLDETAAQKFDETVVRSQLAGYTSARIPVFVNNRVIEDERHLVVITVLPVINTLVVAESDGNVPSGRAVFRKGDVLVRHGSASERWNQRDVDFLLERVIASRKDDWLREFGRDIRHLAGFLGAAPPTVGAESYDLPPEEFHSLVTNLLRRGNG